MLSQICLLITLACASSTLAFNCLSSGQYFSPHPGACDKFIECNNGVAKEIDCIAGLHYNPAVGYCDFPDNVQCVIEEVEEEVEEEGPVESGPVGECPRENQGTVTFLTDASHCTIFYKCNWGTPIQMVCPSGLYFNPILEVCDRPEDAGCSLP